MISGLSHEQAIFEEKTFQLLEYCHEIVACEFNDYLGGCSDAGLAFQKSVPNYEWDGGWKRR